MVGLNCLHFTSLADTQEDLQLSAVNIDDANDDAGTSRLQSRHNSSAGQASVASSVAFDVSLRAAAQLAMLEPGPGQRDPRIDEVSIIVQFAS